MKLTTILAVSLTLTIAILVPTVISQETNDTTLPPGFDDLETSASTTDTHNHDLGISIVQALLSSELVQHKLQKLFDLIDLKVRLFRLINSLLTRENFLLVRSVLDLVARVCNFVISFLPDPDPVADTSGGFFASLFPVLTATPDKEEETVAPPPAATAEIYVGTSIGRVDRSAQLTENEKKLLESHKDDVQSLAKLIYNTNKK